VGAACCWTVGGVRLAMLEEGLQLRLHLQCTTFRVERSAPHLSGAVHISPCPTQAVPVLPTLVLDYKVPLLTGLWHGVLR